MENRDIHQSRSNIFEDLGRPDAAAHMLKAQIVAELYRLTLDRKLAQTQAGALMDLSQPEVSRLFNGTFREYSVDRLMGLLTAFDRNVEGVSQSPRSRPAAPPCHVSRGHRLEHRTQKLQTFASDPMLYRVEKKAAAYRLGESTQTADALGQHRHLPT